MKGTRVRGEPGDTVVPLPLRCNYPLRGNYQYFVQALSGQPYSFKGLCFAMALWVQNHPHVTVDHASMHESAAAGGWVGVLLWTDNTPQYEKVGAAA